MFRAFQVTFDFYGNGTIELSPYIESVQWEIYQMSVSTNVYVAGCSCVIRHNGFFRCASSQGSLDSAEGPPPILALPSDSVTVAWTNGMSGDQANLGVWYNENPNATTTNTVGQQS